MICTDDMIYTIETEALFSLSLKGFIEFMEKVGIEIKFSLISECMGIPVSYKKGDAKLLKEAYIKFKNAELRKAILHHPDCPQELKVAEEL